MLAPGENTWGMEKHFAPAGKETLPNTIVHLHYQSILKDQMIPSLMKKRGTTSPPTVS